MTRLYRFTLSLVLSVSIPAVGSSADPPPSRPPVGVPTDAQYFSGKWYKVILGEIGWKQAREKCTKLGGQLVVVPDEETHEFVRTLAKGLSLWLGATDEKIGGRWLWVDGSEMTFKAWKKGQATTAKGDEHYLFIRDGGWEDHINRTAAVVGFICEWRHK